MGANRPVTESVPVSVPVKRGPGNPNLVKGGPSLNPSGKAPPERLPLPAVSIADEMQWVLDHPVEETQDVFRRKMQKMLLQDFSKFINQLNSIKKGSNGASGEGQKVAVPSEGTATFSPDVGEEKVEALIEQLLSEWGIDHGE